MGDSRNSTPAPSRRKQGDGLWLRWSAGIVVVALLVAGRLVANANGGSLPGFAVAATATPRPAVHHMRPPASAASMGTPPVSSAWTGPGGNVNIVVAEQGAPGSASLAGELLQKNATGAYLHTGRPVHVRWSGAIPVTMGALADIHNGAILQVIGTSAGGSAVRGRQIVVLTGYVTVEPVATPMPLPG
jgi:hypothetical protein